MIQVKGSEVDTVFGDSPDAYPADGIHTDGYWYSINDNAHEWSKWDLKLTPKEWIIYRFSVFFKIDLGSVFKLEKALDRAREEIRAMHGKDLNPNERIRVLFFDPNYGNDPPDCPLMHIHKPEVDKWIKAACLCKTADEYRTVLESLQKTIPYSANHRKDEA